MRLTNKILKHRIYGDWFLIKCITRLGEDQKRSAINNIHITDEVHATNLYSFA